MEAVKTVIGELERGQLREDMIVERKGMAMGSELPAVAPGPVKATLSVKHYIAQADATADTPATHIGDPLKVRSSGFVLDFGGRSKKNGWISAADAKAIGALTVVGEQEDGVEVYEWTASQLGFQPNATGRGDGTWLLA